MIHHNFIAVDIGKACLQVHCEDQSMSVSNDVAGWRKIAAHARKIPKPLIVCEASGGYERPLLAFLASAGLSFRLVNPARVRAFAASEGIKAKTDPIDAKVIFLFAREKNLQAMEAPSALQQKLGELLDRRAQLAELVAREKNHLEKALKETSASCKRVIRLAQAEIEKMETLIRRLIASDPSMSHQVSVLVSVDGVGEVTAWSIVAYLCEITSLPRNKLVALAGVAPFNKDSGTISAKRRICGGRSKVRRCLYMAAHTAATHNPVIKAYVQGLRDRGKPYKCAIVAAMRKLLIHLQSLLRKSSKIPVAS